MMIYWDVSMELAFEALSMPSLRRESITHEIFEYYLYCAHILDCGLLENKQN